MTEISVAERLAFGPGSQDVCPDGLIMPHIQLCRAVEGELECVDAQEVFGAGRVAILGVPGAFTPVCTNRHLPAFAAAAPQLREAGFTTLACIAPNSPWAVAHWATLVDPLGQIQFLSDGNHEFAQTFGLTTRAEHLFLGECSKRFLMSVTDGYVERIRVERQVTDVVETDVLQLL